MACLNQKVSQKFESVLMDIGVEDTMKTLDLKFLAWAGSIYVNLLNLVYLYQNTNMFCLIYCNICNFITFLPFLLNNLGKVGAISWYCCSLFMFNPCKTINFTMFDRPWVWCGVLQNALSITSRYPTESGTQWNTLEHCTTAKYCCQAWK